VHAAPASAGTLTLGELASHPAGPVVERADDDLAALLFTSGTAGMPRAAMLTHGNLRANLEQLNALPARAQRADDIALAVLPLYHIFGLNVVLGMSLYVGARVVMVERFDPVSAAEAVRRHGVTVVSGPPTMWAAWGSLSEIPDETFATVRLANSGAAKLSDEVAATMHTRFGVVLSEGYGLTEASPVVTSSAGVETRVGSIGVPLPGVEVRLVDADGDDALVGDAGELLTRGQNVFTGYWNDPEATRAVLTPDGWLRTGDIAVVDDDGYLYLVDRAKDLIIVSGFNVFPAEVEVVLLDHPAVADAAVIGVAHPHTGEAVKAFVVLKDGQTAEADELIGFCAERLARYKCPGKVMFVDEVPHGIAGKVLRRALEP
jgi:long-chain acyl-CoA synthetase